MGLANNAPLYSGKFIRAVGIATPINNSAAEKSSGPESSRRFRRRPFADLALLDYAVVPHVCALIAKTPLVHECSGRARNVTGSDTRSVMV
jgi:hypothetical protein